MFSLMFLIYYPITTVEPQLLKSLNGRNENMSVRTETSNKGKTVFINVSGRFDYKITKEFRESYSECGNEMGRTYFVNLIQVSYMDSSALGILLLLREHAKNSKGRVIIDRPSDYVYQILKIANFQKLFTINKADAKPDYLSLVPKPDAN